MFILPGFIYRIVENRVGRVVAYIVLFAVIFVVIVMIISHLEASHGN